MDLTRQMRDEWNRRAREDAFFYAGFGRQQQRAEEFLTSAADTIPKIEGELARLPPGPPQSRRALEIGCGPGRLMLQLGKNFGETHGVDISEEMIALASQNLKDTPHAHVHATSGSDLALFPDEYFDFVYSYIVFQHIPDRAIIVNYLRESRRVLKTRGVLCCQLRGAPPLPSEIERETATWTGCFFTADQILAFSRESDFRLVLLEGLETQYLWTTWTKPESGTECDLSRFQLKAVTATTGGRNQVPARGRDAAVSLWIDGLPASCHLGNLQVKFDGVTVAGCYLSQLSTTGACQLDVRLPVGLAEGHYDVALAWNGLVVGESRPLEVTAAPPRRPRVLSISDGINIASKNRVETGGVKVTMEDIERPKEVEFRMAGRPAEFLQYERKDPITGTYEFAFHLSDKTPGGMQRLRIVVSGQELPAERIEVARPRSLSAWSKVLSMLRAARS